MATTTIKLKLIAKQPPQPIGLAAFAYSLSPNSQLQLDYVHSLGQDAPKGENCSLEINGKLVYGLKECYKLLGDQFSNQGVFGKDKSESDEVNPLAIHSSLSLSS